VDSSGEEELQDVQRLIASAAQSYLANGGTALEQLLNALRSRSERVPEEKERALELVMEEELLKEMAEEVDKNQDCNLLNFHNFEIIYKGFSLGSEKEEHKVISDKPVPSRAWASLPATYLTIGKLNKSPGKTLQVSCIFA